MSNAAAPQTRRGPDFLAELDALAADERALLWCAPSGHAWLGVGGEVIARDFDAPSAQQLMSLFDEIPRAHGPAFVTLSFDGRMGEAWEDWSCVELCVPDRIMAFQRPPRPRSAESAGRVEIVDREFAPSVDQALRAIDGGVAEKVVVTRRRVMRLPDPFDLGRTLAALDHAYPDCFVFAHRKRSSTFFGASPERLIRVSNGRFETTALAGTAARGEDAVSDRDAREALMGSTKERREHQYVVDAIVEALAPLTEATELPTGPSARALTNVWHLETPIRGRLRSGVGIADVFARLHPTPAVGGVPREAATRLIAEIEPEGRGLYCGAVGWMDRLGNGELAVALRCGLARGREVNLFAGGGVVAGSRPLAEEAETRQKLRAVGDSLRWRR